MSPVAATSIEERFWVKVEKRPDECWLWRGAIRADGYGAIRDEDGRTRRAHRVAWEMLVGPIPSGMQLDHINCPRHCVNPAHLRVATHAENCQNRRGAYSNSKTGARGVTALPSGRYQVKVGGRYVGVFDTLPLANQVASETRRSRMPFSEQDRQPTDIITRQEAN